VKGFATNVSQLRSLRIEIRKKHKDTLPTGCSSRLVDPLVWNCCADPRQD
jgi:hypothetical protein